MTTMYTNYKLHIHVWECIDVLHNLSYTTPQSMPFADQSILLVVLARIYVYIHKSEIEAKEVKENESEERKSIYISFMSFPHVSNMKVHLIPSPAPLHTTIVAYHIP